VTTSAEVGAASCTTSVGCTASVAVAAGLHAASIPAPPAKPAIFKKSRLFTFFFILLSSEIKL
jgi:hypothetical protein